MFAQATRRALRAAAASLRAVFMSGAVTSTTANCLADLMVEFLDLNVAIEDFGALKLQRDFAFLERDPLIVDHFADFVGLIIRHAIDDVSRAIAADDDFDRVPAFVL